MKYLEHAKHEIKESPVKEIREHKNLREEASLSDVKKYAKECKY